MNKFFNCKQVDMPKVFINDCQVKVDAYPHQINDINSAKSMNGLTHGNPSILSN